MTPAIVQGVFGKTAARPCEPTGRPLDPTEQSWWDAGFRVVGYVPPPDENFDRYIEANIEAIAPEPGEMTPAKAAAVGLIVGALDQVRYLRRNHPDAIGAYVEWLDGLEALGELLKGRP